MPDGISRQATIVGKHVGKVAGLVLGSDFINDRFLEANTGPGTATWNECWNGGARGASDEVAVEQMLTHSLHSIASALNA